MADEYQYWECKDCGHEVLSIGYPMDMKWSDGHRCKFIVATDKLEKEMPDYVESMKNITKGE